MALIVKDRVQQTSNTNGTGTLTLGSSITGFQTFSSAIGNGNTTYYALENVDVPGEWEVGIGTVSAGALSRDTVLESSNSGSLVDFSAGVKNVFCTYPAEKSVDSDTSQTISNKDITGGSINSTPIGATTASTGVFTTLVATGQSSLGGDTGSESLRTLTPVSAAGLRLQVGVPSSTVVRLGAAGSTIADLRILAPTFTNFYTGSSSDGLNDGSAQMRISHTASAVNFVQVTGSATGANPSISAQGSDAIRGLGFNTKSTGAFLFYNNSGANLQFRIDGSQAAVNYLQAQGSVATQAVIHSALGNDTNISMAFQPKGTGAINLAAGSRGVNVSNGGTVTAITRTNAGGAYTTRPTITISAPTTAGGVQATATANLVLALISSIGSGGTGYTVGDVLTISGGTSTQTAQVTVSTVSAGVITAVTVSRGGDYTVAPTNPASVTGGTGTGATFNLTFAILTPVITNAGSGYIEQPTVTFSGGGGSGAAAYATVGSETTIKSLGRDLFLNHPNGIGLQIRDSINGATPAYPLFQSSGTTIQAFASGTSATVGYQWATKGATNHSFSTNSSVANEQFRVAHIASAVNFVQVTGSATGSQPTISAQGSDADITMNFAAKGLGTLIFNARGAEQLRLGTVASTVNSIAISGSIANNAPAISTRGSDTNINLALTPKGTGRVQFGTYTATVSTIAGFIEILDSGGTIRRLAVVA